MSLEWNHLLFTAATLVHRGCLSEEQLSRVIDLVDIKTIVKFNKLSKKFIEDYIIPRIDYDDYDGLDLYMIEKYQKMFE
jgi:predicted house-cleaning NTP pyrophosphatase (Maf/HAM1 superfamily)